LYAGLTGSGADDVASLLSSSWRAMRKLVLWKKSVQEFHFRQYLFAAQVGARLTLYMCFFLVRSQA
jgi:hypothetical protein